MPSPLSSGLDLRAWEEILKGQQRNPILECRLYMDKCHYDINVLTATYKHVMINMAYDLDFPIRPGKSLSHEVFFF